ncbi:MAG: GNAT family N-acetyltransferase [Anaerolineae bacterium]
MRIRPYDPECDQKAVHRIWREVGWIEEGKTELQDLLLSCGRTTVVEHEGEAECLVLSTAAEVRYSQDDLPATAITGVTTSLVARKLGYAGRALAVRLAQDAQDGAAVAGLGIFDQGFYDRLGFGTGSYEPYILFDPADLRVPVPTRSPKRVEAADWEAMHASRLARWRGHGAWSLLPAEVTHSQALEGRHGLGLGFHDGPNGELSHWLWLTASEREHGPYNVLALAYRDGDELLELLGVLRSLGDQIHRVGMTEPFCLQLQDLIEEPFANRRRTRDGKMAQGMHAAAWWQARILGLKACVAAVHLRGEAVRFNLTLHDPIERYLNEGSEWRGIGGAYTASLGQESSVAAGHTPGLAELKASVGAFSRMWLGVRSASSLALTDNLEAPGKLLATLDEAFRLPPPRVDWGF